MTPEGLRALIAGGETLAVEFKGEASSRLSDGDLVEVVVCLANRPGPEHGWLLVGVEDDGRVSGARPRHEAGTTDLARVQSLIAGRTRPSLSVRAEIVRLDGLEVLVLEVPASAAPVGTSDGKYLRRALGGDGRPSCLPFHFHEMQSRQADRGLLDLTALPLAGVHWEDLDPLEFERFRRSVRENRGRSDEALLDLSDLDLGKALGAIEANGEVRSIRMLGLLLFGRVEALRRVLPTHEIAFQVLRAGAVEMNDFLRWPLLRAVEELEGRFRARNREQELMLGMFRVGIPDYPERAFREGVANALVHRDYGRLGAVHVQWHADHIEITNPGGFPEGVRLDNLLVTQPRPRNPLLADAFKRAGLVERTARGIDTIFYEQLRLGRPAPSYERSTEVGVVLLLHGGEASLDFARLVAEESRAERPLGLDELLLLDGLRRERRLTTAEAARLLQKPESEARGRMQALVESGIVEARGERTGRTYHLSASTYRRLGEKAAYVRQRGFEPAQQEQMVLQYVRTHGSIARNEVAELCRLSPPQAYRLLQKLVAKELLRAEGKRGHASRYVPSAN
ncbi:MAG: putative DNA binding domain-containing protein [Planctomycetes bacterium]|nr:putative DNA binding domain-containing protein [Planctomycetota bacterium]